MPLIYKNHTVIAGAAPSHTSSTFIPVVYIAWEIKPNERQSHSIVSDARYSTFEQASAAALDEAKAWVDRHTAELD
jgi:hypothetical protein